MEEQQLNFLDAIGIQDEEEDLLEVACLRGCMADTRVRIFAMLDGGWFPQYRVPWMQREYGKGGFSMEWEGRPWFCDYDPHGFRVSCFRTGKEYRYTWERIIKCIEKLIRRGEYLNRGDERKISEVAYENEGILPYPRARLQYPEAAWKSKEEVIAGMERKKDGGGADGQ